MSTFNLQTPSGMLPRTLQEQDGLKCSMNIQLATPRGSLKLIAKFHSRCTSNRIEIPSYCCNNIFSSNIWSASESDSAFFQLPSFYNTIVIHLNIVNLFEIRQEHIESLDSPVHYHVSTLVTQRKQASSPICVTELTSILLVEKETPLVAFIGHEKLHSNIWKTLSFMNLPWGQRQAYTR